MAELFAQIQTTWDLVRMPLGGLACLIGGLLCIVSAIGVLRFPDIYTRLHAASVTDTGGAGLVLLGMALMAPHWLVLVKVGCIFGLMLLTGATAAHSLANAAHTAGVQPKIGPVGRNDPHADEPGEGH
jgi:multicomponent Na+:H+ antiporter subunit G